MLPVSEWKMHPGSRKDWRQKMFLESKPETRNQSYASVVQNHCINTNCSFCPWAMKVTQNPILCYSFNPYWGHHSDWGPLWSFHACHSPVHGKKAQPSDSQLFCTTCHMSLQTKQISHLPSHYQKKKHDLPSVMPTIGSLLQTHLIHRHSYRERQSEI